MTKVELFQVLGIPVETAQMARARLEGEGRWQEYVNRISWYWSRGQSSDEAAVLALRDFQPGSGPLGLPPAMIGRTAPERDPDVPDDVAQLLRCSTRASGREVLEWVFEHMAVPIEHVSPETAPSRGAYGYLAACQNAGGKTLTKDFYAAYHKLASKDWSDALDDDGESLAQVCDELAELAEATGEVA